MIVEVTGGTRTRKICANTAATLLSAVQKLFGDGLVVDPADVVMTNDYETLTEGGYEWIPSAGSLPAAAAAGDGGSSSGATGTNASGPAIKDQIKQVLVELYGTDPKVMPTVSDSSYGQSVLERAGKVQLVPVKADDRKAAVEWLERAGAGLRGRYKAACSEDSRLKEADVQKLLSDLLDFQPPEHVLRYHDKHKVKSVCGAYKPDTVCCASLCLPTSTALVLDLKGQENAYKSSANIAQVCKYGLALLQQLPSSLRPSILVGLTDLRKILFVRVIRLDSGFRYEVSEEMADVLAVLCAVLRTPADEVDIIKPPEIYYPPNRLLQIDSFLGAGATSVVYKCSSDSSSSGGGNIGGGSSSGARSTPPLAAKVAKQTAIGAIRHEHDVLSALKAARITTCIPEVVDIVNEGQVLLLRPVGVRFSQPDECRPLPAVRPLVDVLERCHKAGWVHCDIRPDNLMLSEGAIFLVDWGFACKLDMARPYSGTTKFASSNILEVLGKPGDQLLKVVTATPADDLVALVKSLYALNHWHEVQPLHQISSTDFERIRDLWAGWLGKAPNWSKAVQAAENCDYNLVADTLSIVLE